MAGTSRSSNAERLEARRHFRGRPSSWERDSGSTWAARGSIGSRFDQDGLGQPICNAAARAPARALRRVLPGGAAFDGREIFTLEAGWRSR